MGFLIFFVLLLILSPYISRALIWLLRRVARKHIEKQTRQMEDAFARAAGLDPEEERRKRRERDHVRNHGGWSYPTPKKKKIDPEDGEYIKYQEVKITVTQTSDKAAASRQEAPNASRSYTVEEQITDVTWEEI